MTAINIVLERLSRLHPKTIDLSLDRVINLLEKLENPHLSIPPAIHVAGTNGKGSTVAFLKAGLEAGKKTVHTYTSPHLVTFNERINLQGKKISNSLLVSYLETCERFNQANNITFFEITTCAAFLAFSKHQANYSLIEVGLGGKLDATNVIQSPLLSIITPVSLDHQHFLGDTILKIATEKAGILKKNVPAIIGKQTREVNEKICSIATNLNAPISLFGRDWHSKKYKHYMIYEDNDGIIELPAPKLQGLHQFENAGIAIAALKLLKIKNDQILKSVQNVMWPARLHKLKTGPLVELLKAKSLGNNIWIDGGHNQAAAMAIASFLNHPFNGETHVILGMIYSKDIDSYLSEIANLTHSITCISIPNVSASLDKEDIFKKARHFNTKVFTAESIRSAVSKIVRKDKNNENLRILICGSLYLCGHILGNHS